jgi:hypothetical protein
MRHSVSIILVVISIRVTVSPAPPQPITLGVPINIDIAASARGQGDGLLTATLGGSLRGDIQFILFEADQVTQVGWTDVTPTPEPATAGLLALALGFIALAVRVPRSLPV